MNGQVIKDWDIYPLPLNNTDGFDNLRLSSQEVSHKPYENIFGLGDKNYKSMGRWKALEKPEKNISLGRPTRHLKILLSTL